MGRQGSRRDYLAPRTGWVLVLVAIAVGVTNLVDEIGGVHLLPAAHTPLYLAVFLLSGAAGVAVLGRRT